MANVERHEMWFFADAAPEGTRAHLGSAAEVYLLEAAELL
jgi:hypothetical protein